MVFSSFFVFHNEPQIEISLDTIAFMFIDVLYPIHDFIYTHFILSVAKLYFFSLPHPPCED